jgi:hypothetical protein
VNTGLSGNTSDIESSAPAPDPYGAGNLASAGETGSEGAYQSIPSTSSEGPADSKSTSSSDTDAGCGGSREGSSDVDACEGGTASQPADNTLWPLPGDAPAPSASMTIPETLPTSYVQPSVTFVKAHPPNGWVSPTAWATSEPIIKPSEITIGSGPGETGFPGNGDEGINAKVVSIIAPNGYGGGTTAVITVSGPSDSWASITPSLIGNIPEYTQLDGRVVDPHQGSDYDSETAETTFMKSERVRNDTNDAAPVVVTDRAYKSTPSCIALLECFTIMACLLL